jgi:TRAP transporter TAXI family solute receptor
MKKLILLALVALLIPAMFVAGQQKKFIAIATGGTAGTYYPLGGAMAEIINKNVATVNASAQSTGASVANINMLSTDEVQMAMVQNDITYYAFNGEEMFKDKKVANLRGIAVLYAETIQIITVTNTRITSLAELKGKRVAVGAAGSGTEANARQILEAAGITYKDISVQYLNFADAANALRDGNVDVAFLTAGTPTAAVRDLASQRDVVVLPVPANIAAKVIQKYPFYTKFTIVKDTYPKQAADVTTLAVDAMLICQAGLDDQTVYEMTKAIFTNLDRLILAHAKGKEIRKETALDGMPIPVHPGAERFFKGL